MIINTITLILGFVILIKGADFFVDGASSTARHFKVSKMLVGLTIVSFGTSAPEFAVSVKSLLSGNGDITLGNVIGSNILNILLILGVASLIHPLTVKNNTVKKELPITLLMTILFGVLLSDRLFDSNIKNTFTRSDGIIILLFFSVFIYYLISMMRHKIDEEEDSNLIPLPRAFIYTIGGIIAIIFGSNVVVDSATNIAVLMGVSQRMVALTVVALGTSLPELVTSIVATKKKEYDIAIGNVVGSNIFNLGIVIGIPTAILGGIGTIAFSYVDLIVMVISAILLWLFAFNDYKLSKKEGIMFLIVFIAYYGYVIFG